MKLLRDFTLDFNTADGAPRMWTVIIGPNGTAKTTILQAIALAAAGPLALTHCCFNDSTHSGFTGRAPCPLSPPTITQSMAERFNLPTSSSRGSTDKNRVCARAPRR